MKNILEIFGASRIVPVVAIDDVEKAVPLAQALVNGGLSVIEVTFRTQCAAEAIKRIRAEVKGATIVAGTVLTVEQLAAAAEAGAEACVSPGYNPAIVKAAARISMPFCPGIATASELSQAVADGCRLVKFFPAESSGGVKYIKDLLGAFRFCGVRFMPTGGINASNALEYLSVPEIICCGGTWVAPANLVSQCNWSAIEALAREASKLHAGQSVARD